MDGCGYREPAYIEASSVHACAVYQSKNNRGYHTPRLLHVVDKAGQQI